MKDTKKPEDLMKRAMECMGVAATLINTEGTLLYYNKQAANILDRKPEYIGKGTWLSYAGYCFIQIFVVMGSVASWWRKQ